jgi:hypothetical protein
MLLDLQIIAKNIQNPSTTPLHRPSFPAIERKSPVFYYTDLSVSYFCKKTN